MNFNHFLNRIADINLSLDQKKRLFDVTNEIAKENSISKEDVIQLIKDNVPEQDNYITKADIADIINNKQFIANIANNLIFINIDAYIGNRTVNNISPYKDYIQLSYDISYMNNNQYYNHHKDETFFYITDIPESYDIQDDVFPSYLNICPDYNLSVEEFNKKTIILNLNITVAKFVSKHTVKSLVKYQFSGTNSIIAVTNSNYRYASYNIETCEYEKYGWISNNYFYIIDNMYNTDKKICHIIINNERILLYNFNNYLKHN